LSDPPSATGLLGALRRVEISDARVEVADYRFGMRWQMPRADFLLERDRAGLRGSLRMEVALGTQSPVITGNVLLERARGDLNFDLHLDRLNPAELATLSSSFDDLKRINVPMSGRIVGRWARSGGVKDVHFDLSVGEGEVLAQADQPPLAVKYAQLVGTINRQQRRLEIQNLYADFGTTKLVASLTAGREGNEAIISASAGIDNMKAAELARYWMPGLAPGARHWVTGNITDGTVPKAQAQLRLSLPLDGTGQPRPLSLDGTMNLENLTVHYFRPLPPATSARGHARFTLEAFNIAVEGAEVGPLKIDRAKVDLLGLHDHSDRADIEVTVSGKLSDQLLLLDNERLGYPRRLGIDSAKARGTAVTQARFMFPLFKDLPIELVAISAASKATDAALPDVVMDQDLSEGTLDLTLDGGGMKITGTGRIGPAKAEFNWAESFLSTVSPGTLVTFSGVMDEAARRAFRVAWPEVIGANVGVKGTYTKNRGQPAKLEAGLDLTSAALTLPWFDWHKPAGESASGNVTVTIASNAVTKVPSFRVRGGGATLRGSVDFASGSRWSEVHLDTLTLPGTELKGSVENKGEGSGFALDFAGAAADIRGIFGEKEEQEATTAAAAPPPTSVLPLDIRFDIGRVVTGENLSLSSAKGHIIRNSRGWTHLEIDGKVGDGLPMTVRLVPSPAGRSLNMACDDAGAMLATLGLMKNIRGGILRVAGQGTGSGPVTASADIKNFRYLQPRTLQRIAAAAQPEGAEALAKDEGLQFSRLKAQFSYAEDSMEVRKARLSGDMLGLTLGGKVDLLGGRLDLNGTIVPLYGINSLVGGIPILGWILTGGEGGGIFAATYTVKGPLRDPETSVNPLSALAPGFLRELFFGDND
jgi:hypothetical protein